MMGYSCFLFWRNQDHNLIIVARLLHFKSVTCRLERKTHVFLARKHRNVKGYCISL